MTQMNKSIINISDANFLTHEMTNFNTLSLYFTLPPSYLTEFCVSVSGVPLMAKLRIEYNRDAKMIPEFAVCEIAAIVKDSYNNIGFDRSPYGRWHCISLPHDDIKVLTNIALNALDPH